MKEPATLQIIDIGICHNKLNIRLCFMSYDILVKFSV